MASLTPDGWRARVDPSAFPRREPGPINVQRYQFVPAYSGIATFLGLPLCLTPEDLRAGGVEVAIVGAPVDMGTGHRGAAFGPRAIRASEWVVAHTPSMLMDSDTRINPFNELIVVDYGDAAVDAMSVEDSMEPIRGIVREIAETGAVPVVLGGDHSILWPDAAALADVYGAGKVGVVHFDAHADCAESVNGHLASHATPIRRLIEDEHIPGRNFIQVGLRSLMLPDDELLAWMRARGMRSHFMAEIDRIGFPAVLDKAIAEALDGPEYLYLSIDIDVLDPAFAPGTATPEPPGLTTRELLPALRRICHETPVVGIEVVEVAPNLDPGNTTAMNARKAIFECLTGLALRKKGIPGPAYLDPIAAGTAEDAESLQERRRNGLDPSRRSACGGCHGVGAVRQSWKPVRNRDNTARDSTRAASFSTLILTALVVIVSVFSNAHDHAKAVSLSRERPDLLASTNRPMAEPCWSWGHRSSSRAR
ncbi:agmatinase family protein [Streptosporangium roseum]|uniref:Agmatinase n=1 Tax=Streptosporangium roseum (strain ATCC 12428 / DSM 43021 / JCM 3005 / KCTC 9067 / NCIMB 10171 / NRRL 2505 / NI 9100) TaxID=479432 RepID=D2AZZ8_STRRD|nr:agmatinase family protein [Streptosporangium roseum]ACZ87232.1 Agmatinase [Streptosporangium roseum DSM 43021]